jgi:hypothetical protein
MKTMQYTIRNVPEHIDRLIRLRAKKSLKSLNAVLLEALERGIGASDESMEYHDLDDLIGTWVHDPDFDTAMEAFESIDEALWK